MHRGKRILLRASTGFSIEVVTGGFYSVKLPKQARYQLRYTRMMGVLYTKGLENATGFCGGVAFFALACYNIQKSRGGERVRKILSQDSLKAIACVSMLLDHIGAVFLPWPWLRILGRLAFPIYCFLLCEGRRHTRSLHRYLLRLGVVGLLAEIPFDLLFYGELTFVHQNVMFTLILGLLASVAVERLETPWQKAAAVVLTILAAELLGTDYGGIGVLLILTLAVGRDLRLWAVMMAVLFLAAGGVQIFGLLALIPIGLCSGRRTGWGRWWMNGFYPAHLVALLLLERSFP